MTSDVDRFAATALNAAVLARVATFRSSWLTDQQAECWLPRLRELVLAVPPVNEEDGKGMFVASCRVLADLAGGVVRDVDELLTCDAVARWSYRALQSGVNPLSVRMYAARVNRLVRVRDGLPGRFVPSGVVTEPCAPLGGDELDELLSRCRDRGGEVLAVAVAAFGAGLTDGRAVGGRVGRMVDGPVFVTAVGDPFPVVPALWSVAVEVAGVVVPDWTWSRLRRCAVAAGTPVSWSTARQTFRFLALMSGLPTAAVLARFGLTKEALDKVHRFLPAVEPCVARQLLRAANARRDPSVIVGHDRTRVVGG